MVVAPTSEFSTNHARQGLAIFFGAIVCVILLDRVLGRLLPGRSEGDRAPRPSEAEYGPGMESSSDAGQGQQPEIEPESNANGEEELQPEAEPEFEDEIVPDASGAITLPPNLTLEDLLAGEKPGAAQE